MVPGGVGLRYSSGFAQGCHGPSANLVRPLCRAIRPPAAPSLRSRLRTLKRACATSSGSERSSLAISFWSWPATTPARPWSATRGSAALSRPTITSAGPGLRRRRPPQGYSASPAGPVVRGRDTSGMALDGRQEALWPPVPLRRLVHSVLARAGGRRKVLRWIEALIRPSRPPRRPRHCPRA